MNDKKPPRKSPKQELFLKAFSKCGNVSMAARQVKISKTDHYRWLKDDATYGERFYEAKECAIEYLEELLLREAEKGQIAAIIFALKAARPEKYRDNFSRIELSGPDGGPMSMATAVGETVNHYLHLSDEDLERIAATSDVLDELDSDSPQPALAESNGQLRIGGPDPDAALDPADAE